MALLLAVLLLFNGKVLLVSHSTIQHVGIPNLKDLSFSGVQSLDNATVKSITLIVSIMRLDEKTSELRQIDKHVHFDSNLLPRPAASNLTADAQWTYKLSVQSFSRLLYRFRITCSPNYYGDECSRFCRQRDDLFGHYSCDRDGQQICMDGWQGEQCDRPVCSANCSLTNGYCKRPNECICKPGYRGADCGECVPHQACVNGYCHLPNQCVCRPNWGGIYCDQDLNLCATHRPCLNNGLCSSVAPNQYKCFCPPGYGGSNCELVLDVCLTEPCLNGGRCVAGSANHQKSNNSEASANSDQGSDKFECICHTGWTGQRCETNINACAQQTNPCGPNGQCVDSDQNGGYQCRCERGFTGPRCDQNIDECAQTIDGQGCVMSNTERCVDTIGSFECRCLPGWSGKFCQTNIDDCASNPCLNQAQQCIDLVNDYKCLCAKGLKGKNCDQFDESVCSGARHDDEIAFLANDMERTGEENQYWQIETEAKPNRSTNCKSRWCTCSGEASQQIESEVPQGGQMQLSQTKEEARRRLNCVCIREDEYEQLNRRQLEKLNLALNPTVDQLMLVSGEDLAQQSYLLGQLPLKLQKQTSSGGGLAEQASSPTLGETDAQPKKLDHESEEDQSVQRMVNQLEAHKSNKGKEIISEVLIDGELDAGDNRFVSIALNFGQRLDNVQVQSVCASMLAIYSLVRRQPDLEQLNVACKPYVPLPQATTVRFYTLDNDERLLSVAEIVQKSLSASYRLESILKRTYRLSGSDGRLTGWKLHALLVMNICLLFWLLVIVIMIGVLLHNEQLRSLISRSRMLRSIAVRLRRKSYGRNEEALSLNNQMNHIVIHNNLNRPRYENDYVLPSGKQFDKSQVTMKQNNCFLEHNKASPFKQLSYLNVEEYDLKTTNNDDLIKEPNPLKLKDGLEVDLPNKPLSYQSKKIIQPVHL